MLSRFPTKPCRYCGSRGHYPYQCFKNPKRKETLKPVGKTTKQWLVTRATWIRNNPPNQDPYPHYVCYLCGAWLALNELTLDHRKSRSRHPELRYSADNLSPACYTCNQNKGSKDYDEDITRENKQ